MKKVSDTPIQGVHTYDMLKNPIYANAFQYVSVYVITNVKREDLIIDGRSVHSCAQSDLVRLILWFPFLPKDVQD